MKNSLKQILTALLAIALLSCNTTKKANTNLPQDISERPINENSQK